MYYYSKKNNKIKIKKSISNIYVSIDYCCYYYFDFDFCLCQILSI